MDVRMGDLWAKCPECRGIEFNPLEEPQPDGNQKIRCKICGTATTRAELLVQIGDEASRLASDGLERLESKGPGA